MRIDAGLDTGDMLLEAETEIGPEETAPELSARLAEMGARLLIETMASTTIVPEKQDHSQHSLAPILKKEDGLIDWRQPAARIHARARGFQPWPGAYTTFRGQTLHIWKCTVAPAPAGAPGTLMLRTANGSWWRAAKARRSSCRRCRYKGGIAWTRRHSATDSESTTMNGWENPLRESKAVAAGLSLRNGVCSHSQGGEG